jgi:hypothetical protein
MRHPSLQRAYQLAMLDAYPKTSVVTIAPVARAFEVARSLTIIFHLRLADLEFARRRIDRFEEYGACKEISDRQEFQQWLLDRVRKMGLSTSSVKPSIYQHIHKF